MPSSDIHATSNKGLYRRVKRHLIGREHLFFAATSPGLERLCLKELRAIVPESKSMVCVEGGVEFKGRLTDCYRVNLHSRIANRILMRLESFKATNFNQLEKTLLKLPWELYLISAKGLTFKNSSKHSRLYHSGAVEDHFHHAISDRLTQYGLNKADSPGAVGAQTIFIRVVDDRFFISMDSSGDHLHKRGIKKHAAKAPIRETLAAAAIMMAGHDPNEPLVDPMCGSGTFAIEAAMMAGNIPAGWFRDFAFREWPAFRSRQWEYIRKKAAKKFTTASETTVFASDKDTKAVHRLGNRINRYGFSDTICVFPKDFFDIYPKTFVNQTGLVMINPPYGRRLGQPGDRKRFYESIFDKLIKDFKGWKMGLMVPDKRIVELCPFKVKSYPFFHGGLKLTLVTGRIP